MDAGATLGGSSLVLQLQRCHILVSLRSCALALSSAPASVARRGGPSRPSPGPGYRVPLGGTVPGTLRGLIGWSQHPLPLLVRTCGRVGGRVARTWPRGPCVR